MTNPFGCSSYFNYRLEQHIKPVLFVINNDGYTVERLIHGMYRPYNEIHMWDYKALPAVLVVKYLKIITFVIIKRFTRHRLDAINGHPDVMHFVEKSKWLSKHTKKLIDIAKAFSQQNK